MNDRPNYSRRIWLRLIRLGFSLSTRYFLDKRHQSMEEPPQQIYYNPTQEYFLDGTYTKGNPTKFSANSLIAKRERNERQPRTRRGTAGTTNHTPRIERPIYGHRGTTDQSYTSEGANGQSYIHSGPIDSTDHTQRTDRLDRPKLIIMRGLRSQQPVKSHRGSNNRIRIFIAIKNGGFQAVFQLVDGVVYHIPGTR